MNSNGVWLVLKPVAWTVQHYLVSAQMSKAYDPAALLLVMSPRNSQMSVPGIIQLTVHSNVVYIKKYVK